MKRSEIKVGDELYYSRSNDWATPRYGSGPDGEKAKVVGLWWHKNDRWSSRANFEVPAGTKGAGILVEYTARYSGSVRREVVPPAHLRGPYEETRKQVAEWVVEREASNRQLQERRERVTAAAGRTVGAAMALGVSAQHLGSRDDQMRVPTKQFAAMVTALAEVGWHYESKEEN